MQLEEDYMDEVRLPGGIAVPFYQVRLHPSCPHARVWVIACAGRQGAACGAGRWQAGW
jgi:hypothetical protein